MQWRWNDKQLFKIVEPMVIQEMPSMTCTGLSQVANSFVAVGCGSRLLYNQLVQCCFQTSNQFAAEEVAVLVSAFSKAPHKPKTFLLGFACSCLKTFVVLFSTTIAGHPIGIFILATWGVSKFCRGDDSDFAGRSTNNEHVNLKFGPGPPFSGPSGIVEPRQHEKIEPDGNKFYLLSLSLQMTNSCQPTFWLLKNWPMWCGHIVKWNQMACTEKTVWLCVSEHFTTFQRIDSAKFGLLPFEHSSSGRRSHSVLGWNLFRVIEIEGTKGWPIWRQAIVDEAETHVVRCMGEMDSRDLTAVVQAYSLSNCGSAELFSAFLHSTTERCRQLAADQLTSSDVELRECTIGALLC